MTSTEAPGTRNCVSCGRSIGWDANVCPYCGHDYRMRMIPVSRPGTSRARAGGVLILIAGVLAVLMGIGGIALASMNPDSYGLVPPSGVTVEEIQEILAVLGIAAFILGFIGVIGGMFAIQKRRFGWAIVGGVTALLGIGFLIGAALAIIGLILIALSKDEFGGPSPPKVYPSR